MSSIQQQVQQVKSKWPLLVSMTHKQRCSVIEEIAQALSFSSSKVLQANASDLAAGKEQGLSLALLDRLTLTESRLQGMIGGLHKIAELPDPLEDTISWFHPNGMQIQKRRVPIGVILVVYEARPNVTTDTVGLVIKTGNAAILKGSRQTTFTNTALADIINGVLSNNSLDGVVKSFPSANADQSLELVSSPDVDLIIPRGGEGLRNFVKQHAVAPVLGAGGGVCHLYISSSADLDKAAKILMNAKTQRPGVCNALETVLLHESLLKKENIDRLFIPLLELKVEVRGDAQLCQMNANFKPAVLADWESEYLDLILSAKVVGSTDEAIAHINKYGTGHSDSIITEDKEEAEKFCQFVDSGCVYVNASTRFTDGEEFGFGAEIGISTQKLHARGPIGPRELITYKYVIVGDGQIRP